MYHCSKTYPHSLGLSAAFRQHRAKSHCRLIHGYALAFKYDFVATDLDANNWVLDFGSMKPIKQWLESKFDHKLIVAEDDPYRGELLDLHTLGIAHVETMPRTGCEAFAVLAYEYCEGWLVSEGHSPRVSLERVTCSEHEGNAASFFRQDVREIF